MFAFFSPLASAASFECAKAASSVEKLVCADPALLALDDKLHKAYKGAVSRTRNEELMRQWQDGWLKGETLGKCTAADCIETAYSERIALLEKAVASDWNGQYTRYSAGKADSDSTDIFMVVIKLPNVRAKRAMFWSGTDVAASEIGGVMRDAFYTDGEQGQLSITLKGNGLLVEGDYVQKTSKEKIAGEYRRKGS